MGLWAPGHRSRITDHFFLLRQRRASVRSWTRPWSYSGRRSWCWRWTGLRTVSSPIVEIVRAIISTPDNHFAARPHCRVTGTANRCLGRAGRYPTVCAWSVSTAGVHYPDQVIVSSPDNHFAPTPYCSMKLSTRWGVCHAGVTPTVSRGIVSAATGWKASIVPTPNDNFIASPDRCVTVPT